MNKNIKIIILSILAIPILLLLIYIIINLIQAIIFIPGVASIILILIFTTIVILNKISWETYGIYFIIISAFLSMFIDSIGNKLLNFPFNFFLRNSNQSIEIIQNLKQSGANTSISLYYLIVDSDGRIIRNINPMWIYTIRYIEYLIIFSILITIINKKNKTRRTL